jgi:hypothetical protein
VEATSPAPDNLGVHLQAPGDLGVRRTLAGVEDELGALHSLVRERVARRPMLELRTLLADQDDLIALATRHRPRDSPEAT